MKDWMIRCRLFCAVLAVAAAAGMVLLSCGDNPAASQPQQPDFYITSVLFTGDSVGSGTDRSTTRMELSARRVASRGTPYCEVTVNWTAPESRVTGFNLYRSTEPEVNADDRLVATSTETQAVDTDSLQWGTTYYYAVSGMTSDSTVLWSDEGSITTPLSQSPTPSVLSATALPMGRCQLSWTECPDDDFDYYILLRQRYPYSIQADTLAVFFSAGETTYPDSLPPMYSPRYYTLITTDTQDISVSSNMLEYSDGFGLPWYTDIVHHGDVTVQDHIIVEETMTSSWDEDRIYYVEKEWDWYSSSWDLYIRRVSTETGASSNRWMGTNDYGIPLMSHSPDIGRLLAARQNPTYSSDLLLLNDGTLATRDSLHFNSRIDGLLAVPNTGKALVCLENAASTLVLDLYSLQVTDTLDFTFRYGQVTGGHVYVWGGNTPMCRLDPSTFDILATSSIYTTGTNIVTADNGDLYFIHVGLAYRLDPWDLSTIASYTLPANGGASLYVNGDVLYAYLYDEDTDDIEAVNLETSENMGSILTGEDLSLVGVADMLTLPGLNQIWCTGGIMDEYYYGAFNIAR